MQYKIPESMKAVRLYEANGPLIVDEVPVPKPGKGEVLVKMAASPMNPSDLSFMMGNYIIKPDYPAIPGLEGSGLVVDSGGGILANLRKGKRVTCSSPEGRGGTWAEYMVTPATRVIPIADHISDEQGAMLIVNPMTVLAFMEIIKKGNYKAVINNAAASTLGGMLRKTCKSAGVDLINIVRRNEHVEQLKSEGAEHVLNSSDADFEEQLEKLAHSLDARLCFEAVGSDQPAKILKALPQGGRLMFYSNMSLEPFTMMPREIMQGEKVIEGFYLGAYAKKRNIIQSLIAAKKVQKLVNSELESSIRKVYPLEEAQKAREDYISNMSSGKILLKLT